jgi:hypothetical protein
MTTRFRRGVQAARWHGVEHGPGFTASTSKH